MLVTRRIDILLFRLSLVSLGKPTDLGYALLEPSLHLYDLCLESSFRALRGLQAGYGKQTRAEN